MSENWKSVQPEIWKPKENEFIEGVLVAKRSEVGEKKSHMYLLEVEPGKMVKLWGSVVLDELMEFVDVGNRIRVIYKGKDKNDKAHIYDVLKPEGEDVKNDE